MEGLLNFIYKVGQTFITTTLDDKFSFAKDIHKLELSAVFLYRCRQLYMKKGGKIFFIVSNAFMTGI